MTEPETTPSDNRLTVTASQANKAFSLSPDTSRQVDQWVAEHQAEKADVYDKKRESFVGALPKQPIYKTMLGEEPRIGETLGNTLLTVYNQLIDLHIRKFVLRAAGRGPASTIQELEDKVVG